MSAETQQKLLQALRRLHVMVEPLIEQLDIDPEQTEIAVSVVSEGKDERPIGKLNLAEVLAEAKDAIKRADEEGAAR